MVSWEVMLSKGQEWDWLGDPFWRVQTLVIFFGAGLVALIFWELRHRNPVVNFRLLANVTWPRAASSFFALISHSLPQGTPCWSASGPVWL